MSQREKANYFEELRRQNAEARKDAFALFGVAHYNYNGILRFRQSIERRVLEEQEKTMAEIKEIITNLEDSGTNLEESMNKYTRMMYLNEHIQEEFRKKIKQIRSSNLKKNK